MKHVYKKTNFLTKAVGTSSSRSKEASICARGSPGFSWFEMMESTKKSSENHLVLQYVFTARPPNSTSFSLAFTDLLTLAEMALALSTADWNMLFLSCRALWTASWRVWLKTKKSLILQCMTVIFFHLPPVPPTPPIIGAKPVLRFWDVYPRSTFSIPDPRSEFSIPAPDPHQRI